ncbi:MAG: alpha amylase C-terminal domain-containing protein [Steroidobacteraceae bacterium]
MERLNSDAPIYDGSGVGNMGASEAVEIASHGRPFSLLLRLPPLGMLVFTPQE